MNKLNRLHILTSVEMGFIESIKEKYSELVDPSSEEFDFETTTKQVFHCWEPDLNDQFVVYCKEFDNPMPCTDVGFYNSQVECEDVFKPSGSPFQTAKKKINSTETTDDFVDFENYKKFQ